MINFRLIAALCFAASTPSLLAQAPGVKIVHDRGEDYGALVQKANEARAAGQLLSADSFKDQLSRTSCVVKLSKPATKKLTDREIWRRSMDAHVKLGWSYLCKKCDKWHLNLAGGCFVTADGVIATCYHVVKPNPEHREAFLVAGDESGNLYAVTEFLAGDELLDVALVKAKVNSRVPHLALNTNVYPGDGAWCYSDPLGRSSYFSKGMVNRFYMQQGKERTGPRIEVSTDWAPGSSGSAVLDECANVMGLVSAIQAAGSSRAPSTNKTASASSAVITFHCASRAADVIGLVKAPAKK